MNDSTNSDPDSAKGAVEPSRPEDDAEGNVAPFKEQLDHRFQDPLNKSSDSGLPGSGQTPEHSMEQLGENKLEQDTADPARSRDGNPDVNDESVDRKAERTQRKD